MTVLQVGPMPPPYGGVARNMVAIRSYLRRRGIRCAVVNVTRFRQEDADDVYYPKGALGLVRVLVGLRCDVIHIHFGGLLTLRLLCLYFLCSLLPHRRVVLTFHSGGYPSTAAGRALTRRSFAGFVFRRLDRVIAVNTEVAAFLHRLGVEPARVRLIAPQSFLAGEEPTGELPEPLGSFFATHARTLVTVSGLEPEYDVASQVRVLGEIRARWPGTGLVIIGSGSLEAALRTQIEASGYAEHILLCGGLPHPITLQAIARADTLLRTTLYDGDAISVREALHLGTPVVATDNGMRPAGVTVVPVSDSAALRDAVDRHLAAADRPRPAGLAPDEGNLEAVLKLYEEFSAAPDGAPRRIMNSSKGETA